MNIAKLYIVNIAYFQEHLHTTTSEVSLGSDCLGLSFWTVTFKHPDLLISQNTSLFQTRALNIIRRIYPL